MSTSGVSRRQALSSVATVGLGLPLLHACGGGGTTTATDSVSPSETPPETSSSPETDTVPLATTADVPVGGGLIVADSSVVITQPVEGEFKGFSATCPHQGCMVADVTETINCNCHGSTFSIETGEPTGGPASSPLGQMTLTVEGDQITLT